LQDILLFRCPVLYLALITEEGRRERWLREGAKENPKLEGYEERKIAELSWTILPDKAVVFWLQAKLNHI